MTLPPSPSYVQSLSGLTPLYESKINQYTHYNLWASRGIHFISDLIGDESTFLSFS